MPADHTDPADPHRARKGTVAELRSTPWLRKYDGAWVAGCADEPWICDHGLRRLFVIPRGGDVRIRVVASDRPVREAVKVQRCGCGATNCTKVSRWEIPLYPAFRDWLGPAPVWAWVEVET